MLTNTLRILCACLKVGCLAFGGGNAAIPLLEAEAVPRWLSEQDFAELVGLNFAFPGVSVLKLAAMVGLRVAGIPGMLAALIGLTTPGLLLTVAAYGLLSRYRDHPLVSRALRAMQYAAVALLLSSALKILQTAMRARLQPLALLLLALIFVAVHFLQLTPALAVVAAVLLGMWIF